MTITLRVPKNLPKKYGVGDVYSDYKELLKRDDIDTVGLIDSPELFYLRIYGDGSSFAS